MPDIDHAGFHRGVGKSWESNMCHFPASTILLLTLCQWFRTLYNTQKAIQENQDATIDAFTVICSTLPSPTVSERNRAVPNGSECFRVFPSVSECFRVFPSVSDHISTKFRAFPSGS